MEAILQLPISAEEAPLDAPKKFSKVLVNRANRFLGENPTFTQAALARKLGVSPSTLNRYLSGKPEGNVQKLEALLGDVLKAEEERKRDGVVLIETAVSQLIEGAIEEIRQNGDMGCIFGPPGVGKTCGIKLYVRNHPTTLLITASEWDGSGTDMRHLIWEDIDSRGWSTKKGSQAHFLVERFRGSDRPFIIDECHELKRTGRKFWRHFHDATGCPIIYAGKEKEFMDKVAEDSQHYSRIGYIKRLSADTTENTAEAMVLQYTPTGWAEISDLAMQVVKEADGGHARSLRKQLRLALSIQSKTGKDLRTCFLAAHGQLHRKFKLVNNRV